MIPDEFPFIALSTNCNINECRGVNLVPHDITSKLPEAIEWE